MLAVQSVRQDRHGAVPARQVRKKGAVTHRSAGRYAAAGGLAALIGLVILPAVWMARGPASDLAWLMRLGVFALSLLAMVSMMCAVGVAVTGQRAGVLWTSRNAYSLSRLQVVMWTVLVLSALVAVVACRAHGLIEADPPMGLAGALAVEIPSELLQVMGISILSAAAAPAILSVKANTDAARSEVDAAQARVGGALEAAGRVAVRPGDYEPLLRDLFQGDEVAKAGVVDPGKVQQAVVTLVLWGAYLAMLADLFVRGTTNEAGATPLPAMSETFVYLLGISHVGYLAYKAAPAASAAPAATLVAPSETLPRPLPPSIR